MDFSKKLKRDEYSGKKCFIAGSGPSLAYKDLSFIKLLISFIHSII